MAIFGRNKDGNSNEMAGEAEPLPRVYDEPAYMAAAELLAAFRQRLARLEQEKQMIDLERHLGARFPDPKSTTDQSLRAKLAALKALPPLTPVPSAPSTGLTPAISAGLEVMKGGTIAAPPGRAARVGELDAQIDTLSTAIREQSEIVQKAVEEISEKISRRIKPGWDAAQIAMYRAAQELARATRRVRDFRAAINEAGIRSRSDLLLTPCVRAPLVLGDEDVPYSEISEWRRILENLGILK